MSKLEQSTTSKDAEQIEDILEYLIADKIANLADVLHVPMNTDTCQLLVPPSNPESTTMEWKKVSTANFAAAVREYNRRMGMEAKPSQSLLTTITSGLMGLAKAAKKNVQENLGPENLHN